MLNEWSIHCWCIVVNNGEWWLMVANYPAFNIVNLRTPASLFFIEVYDGLWFISYGLEKQWSAWADLLLLVSHALAAAASANRERCSPSRFIDQWIPHSQLKGQHTNLHYYNFSEKLYKSFVLYWFGIHLIRGAAVCAAVDLVVMGIMTLLWLATFVQMVHGTCFPDAVPKQNLKNLVGSQGTGPGEWSRGHQTGLLANIEPMVRQTVRKGSLLTRDPKTGPKKVFSHGCLANQALLNQMLKEWTRNLVAPEQVNILSACGSLVIQRDLSLPLWSTLCWRKF